MWIPAYAGLTNVVPAYGFKWKQHIYAFTANQAIANNVMRKSTMRWRPLFSQLNGDFRPTTDVDWLELQPACQLIHASLYYTLISTLCVEVDAVKSESVRTNIVLDSKLIAAGLKATGLTTRRELVDFALRELLRHKQQKKLLQLKGKVSWEGDLDEMRKGRGR